MPAIISSNTLRLEPDGLSAQTARVQLPAQPAGANVMVFYYKAYMEAAVGNNPAFEDGSSYAWGTKGFFGLSYDGDVNSNSNAVGFGNRDNGVLYMWGPQAFAPFAGGSGFGSVQPVSFGVFSSEFSIGRQAVFFNASNGGFEAGRFCPTTINIGVEGAQKYLGIVQVARHRENVQQVVFSYGNNWQGLAADHFASALPSSLTNWAFRNIAQTDIINARPNHANADVALQSTINFPSWVVVRWPSNIVGRNLVITDIKVEYYD